MLPGVVAGHYRVEEAHIDLANLSQRTEAHFHETLVSALDAARQIATLSNGARIEFDLASIDIGSAPGNANIAGAAEHSIDVRPIDRFLRAWTGLIERARAGALRRLAVVGGGAAGVETLLAMQYRLGLEAVRGDAIECHLITDDRELLPTHNERVQRIFSRICGTRGIEVHLANPAVKVERDGIYTASGRVAADAMVWATGAAAAPWLRNTGLGAGSRGLRRGERTLAVPFASLRIRRR